MNPAKVLDDSVITTPDYRPGPLRHSVLFQYAKATTSEQRQEIEERFHALSKTKRQGKRYIASIESGIQNSPEGLQMGLEHGFIVTFESEGAGTTTCGIRSSTITPATTSATMNSKGLWANIFRQRVMENHEDCTRHRSRWLSPQRVRPDSP
jgi:Stress responsive A/B Barrel Domain